MSGLRIRCPETGAAINTGFDAGSFDGLQGVFLTLEDCPRCGEAHAWRDTDVLPETDPAASAQASAIPVDPS